MKSKRAGGFINEHLYMGLLSFTAADIEYCAMLAGQEAEERMRKKAEEAFLSYCYCEERQYVRKKCENCEAYKSFIQELNEE